MLSKEKNNILKFNYLIVALLIFFFNLSSCNKSIDTNSKSFKMMGVIDTANSFLRSQEYKNAITYIDLFYNKESDLSLIDLYQKYNFKSGFYLNYERNISKAKLNVDSNLLLLKNAKQKFPNEYVNALFNKGDLNFAERKYDEGLEAYFNGLKFAQEHLTLCEQSDFTSRLAFVKYKQEDFQKVIVLLKKSNQQVLQCNNSSDFYISFVRPQSNYNTIALCFERLGNLDSSVYYYKKALNFIKDNKKKYPQKKQFVKIAEGVIYGNLGGTYYNQKKYNEAEYYLMLSMKINTQPGYDLEDAKTARAKLAYVFIDQNKINEFKQLLPQIQADVKENSNRLYDASKLDLFNIKRRYFGRIKNIDSNLKYIESYYLLKDSISRYKEELRKINFDTEFKINDQQHRLDVLKKNSEIKNAYLIGIVAFLILLAVVLRLVWGNLNRSKKYVLELKSLNNKIADHNVQIQYALESLEQSQLDNDKLKKVVAHDLRNPIGGIVMAASFLKAKSDIKSEKMLDLIEKSGNSALILINDLLSAQYAADEMEMEEIDFYGILSYCADLLRLRAARKDQGIQLRASHVKIALNKHKIIRVFNNLIDNAIKFSPSGAIVSISSKVDKEWLITSIEDFGEGVPDDLGDKIFDMYTSAKKIGTIGEKTFGMGLSISKRIVEAHGGQISYKNKPNKSGAIFIVQLPLI
jgi:signal transduction histidine kinase